MTIFVPAGSIPSVLIGKVGIPRELSNKPIYIDLKLLNKEVINICQQQMEHWRVKECDSFNYHVSASFHLE
jgi:hypothetical protein